MENDKHIENLEETSQEVKTNILGYSAGESTNLTRYHCANGVPSQKFNILDSLCSEEINFDQIDREVHSNFILYVNDFQKP